MGFGWRCLPARTGGSIGFALVLRILLTSPKMRGGLLIFFWRGEYAKNKGILRKWRVLTWCFDGVSVVICVAEMEFKQSYFRGLETRHRFQLYFCEAMSCRTDALRGRRSLRDLYTPSVGAPVGREGRLTPTNGRTARSSKKACERPRSAQEARPAGQPLKTERSRIESETFPVTRGKPSHQCLD
jgi:hypothetical protein